MEKYTIRRDIASRRINFSEELNPSQLDVVTCKGGPMLVLAGAGTGKTTTVTYRVAWLIEQGVRPSEILLLTFTNKAAKEMMSRAETLAGGEISSLWGGTFHHIGNTLLRRYAELLGYTKDFTILDRADTNELFDSCKLEYEGSKLTAGYSGGKAYGVAPIPKAAVLSDIYSYVKNTSKTIEDSIAKKYSKLRTATDDIIAIFKLYEHKKTTLNLMDFDDLLINLKVLLTDFPDVREQLSGRFKHVLVDEYQDTNSVQAEIVYLLSSVHKNIMAVGDDAQAIFSFRGANLDNILNFHNYYPNTKIFRLTYNYRSTPQILNLANAIIRGNRRQYRKDLESSRNDVTHEGKPCPLPYLVELSDVEAQAEFVCSKLRDIAEEGGLLSNVSVLYRAHYQSLELQLELTRHGIFYEVRSGMKFFEMAHIKDVMAYLKVVVNPFDEIGWKRILKMIPGVGNKTIEKFWVILTQNQEETPLDALPKLNNSMPQKGKERFRQLLETIEQIKNQRSPSKAITLITEGGYEQFIYEAYTNAESRLEDIDKMSEYAIKYDSISTFVSDMAIGGDTDEDEEAGDSFMGKVVLTSVHQAKGLEWKRVFIIGLNDGQFPLFKSIAAGEEEEERRLFYVAVTRACDELYLCNTQMSNIVGPVKPSRFIDELESRLYQPLEISYGGDNDIF
ncbi:MAG: ATP-dependent helicase [Nitrospirae bacterium]|nr:ATP-dependent helicase [Nitrospirota bacterium]MBF0535649.1 ATP-dependent helicase [Nitrospirota bacterium]MBF0616955.1 ATP-dependent helicase [Nitrospirota bacterium]